ncbi:MAG: three-Cys-motif partner protein TcmP [Mycobacterium sp.]
MDSASRRRAGTSDDEGDATSLTLRRFRRVPCDYRCNDQRLTGDGRDTMTRKQEIRDEVDYPSDAHTRLKHAFYRRYVACWMPRVLQGKWGSAATVVEGFSGSGKYSDGPDGSALMIAKLYRDHIHSANFHPLKFVTNDLDPRRTAALNTRLAALPSDARFEHIPLEPATFESIVDPVQASDSPSGRRTLWIVDPFGLKQIPWKAVASCATRLKNDVLITLMVDEMHRYRTNPVMDGLMTATFGSEEWKDLPTPRSTAESKAALIALYRKRLETLGCLTQSFDIDVQGRKSRYSLIFVTHHQAGLECFNDAKWSADTAGGKGASAVTGFELTLFEPEIGGLIAAFEEMSGLHQFEDLVENAARLGFKETHVRTVLDELFARGMAFRLEPATSPKNSPWPAGSSIALYTQIRVDLDEDELEADGELDDDSI